MPIVRAEGSAQQPCRPARRQGKQGIGHEEYEFGKVRGRALGHRFAPRGEIEAGDAEQQGAERLPAPGGGGV